MGDFERTFGRTSDDWVDRTREYDPEPVPTPIPTMPNGMSRIEQQLFCDLRAAANNMADLLGVPRGDLLSDWMLFIVIAKMPTTADEMNSIQEVRISACTDDFLSLVKNAIVAREAAEAAFKAAEKAREEKIRVREQEVRAAKFARKLDEYVAAGVFPSHGKLVVRNKKK